MPVSGQPCPHAAHQSRVKLNINPDGHVSPTPRPPEDPSAPAPLQGGALPPAGGLHQTLHTVAGGSPTVGPGSNSVNIFLLSCLCRRKSHYHYHKREHRGQGLTFFPSNLYLCRGETLTQPPSPTKSLESNQSSRRESQNSRPPGLQESQASRRESQTSCNNCRPSSPPPPPPSFSQVEVAMTLCQPASREDIATRLQVFIPLQFLVLLLQVCVEALQDDLSALQQVDSRKMVTYFLIGCNGDI